MKILVADDHPLFRAGIRHVLSQLDDGVLIYEAGDHAAVESHLEQDDDFSLLLLDLAMPGVHGLTVLEFLTQQYPALPVVILSASQDRLEMQRALDRGALGFIEKSATSDVMLSALRLVLSGGVYIPPALIRSDYVAERSLTVAPSPNQDIEFTPRQSAVLRRMVEGKSNKAIAMELGLTEATVKAHVTAVFKTLRVANRMQAAIAISRLASQNV